MPRSYRVDAKVKYTWFINPDAAEWQLWDTPGDPWMIAVCHPVTGKPAALISGHRTVRLRESDNTFTPAEIDQIMSTLVRLKSSD